MTEKLEQFVNDEIAKQIGRVRRYVESDSKPTPEEIYTTIQISKAYLKGIGKTLKELGKVKNFAPDWLAEKFDRRIEYNPLTGEYSFK